MKKLNLFFIPSPAKILMTAGLLLSFFIYSSAQTVINYSFEAAVQHFVVPPGVSTITITIAGAKGGDTLGGKGASFEGICSVHACHVISLVIGQRGALDTFGYAGGGGGGGGASWLYDSNVVLYSPSGVYGLLAVAAGGGGEGSSIDGSNPNPVWSYYAGSPGGIDLLTNASTTDSVYCGRGGTGGNGGGMYLQAGGGAGWISNGEGASNFYGRDKANHFVMGSSIDGIGGFGGGGGSCDFTFPGPVGVIGGGGGGYNGGGAGLGGGGGGSYLNGTLVGTATASDTGNGYVTISYIPPLSQVIDIYPNPTSGVFTVNGIRQEQVIEIYNCLGQKLQTLQASNTIIQLDLSTYASGVYMVIVRNADGSKVVQTKVVKV